MAMSKNKSLLVLRNMAARVVSMALLAASFLPVSAHAEPVAGEVAHVQGAVTAQQKDEAPRFVSKGDPLQEGDVLMTSNRGYAIIGLQDGTKMTLRPSTVFSIDEYKQAQGKAGFSLVRGGIRGATGEISKNPDAMKIRAKDATLAVREVSAFDARLCEADCATEAENLQGKSADTGTATPIVGKVAKIQGKVTATGVDGKSRELSKGAAVFSEDKLESMGESNAVLVFRDQSRMTVTPNSVVVLENVKFEGADSSEGSFSARLVKGGMRALTGLLGKRKPEAVKFNAATATIGIRGTGLDVLMGEHCLSPQECFDALYTNVWDGAVGVDADGKSILVALGKTGVYIPLRKLLFLLDSTPDIIDENGRKSPRPDKLDIDFENLFGLRAIELFEPGLYVTVRNGHLELIGPGGSIDLGEGESGYLKDGEQLPIRLVSAPSFMLNDIFPLPDGTGGDLLSILEMFNPGSSPGDPICVIK
jgi:hypothetical protein